MSYVYVYAYQDTTCLQSHSRNTCIRPQINIVVPDGSGELSFLCEPWHFILHDLLSKNRLSNCVLSSEEQNIIS